MAAPGGIGALHDAIETELPPDPDELELDEVPVEVDVPEDDDALLEVVVPLEVDVPLADAVVELAEPVAVVEAEPVVPVEVVAPPAAPEPDVSPASALQPNHNDAASAASVP